MTPSIIWGALAYFINPFRRDSRTSPLSLGFPTITGALAERIPHIAGPHNGTEMDNCYFRAPSRNGRTSRIKE